MFEKTFCSSPWFHARLTYDGSYESCRWAKNPKRIHRFQDQTLMQYYNSDQMQSLRQQLLLGESPEHCETCYYEESFGKLNGRVRQLTKSAIDVDNFDLTIRSSPHYENFKYSLNHNGLANMAPVDLQIELGNTCNSACIMCVPEASSRLEQDYHKLHKINDKLFAKPNAYTSWTQDPELVDRFVKEIIEIPNLRYIHFLGGETLHEESFYSICEQLIEHDLAKNIIVGTTTNGTIFNDRIKRFIENFKQFHLGISIESVTDLNDYIRWPGKINSILPNISKLLMLRESNPEFYVSLRITPNVFSVYEIDKLFVYLLENNVIAESCNILHDPAHLRMELIPEDIRNEVKKKLEILIDYYKLEKIKIVNVRRLDQIRQVIANVILDYYQFLCDYQQPVDAEQSRYNLIDFLKAFESLRGNSILDYAPRYEKFLRHYGY
jgi:sulfatase maturation enzyme AslB (radical SAM superfamily)